MVSLLWYCLYGGIWYHYSGNVYVGIWYMVSIVIMSKVAYDIILELSMVVYGIIIMVMSIWWHMVSLNG